jgi:hypothetical protein
MARGTTVAIVYAAPDRSSVTFPVVDAAGERSTEVAVRAEVVVMGRPSIAVCLLSNIALSSWSFLDHRSRDAYVVELWQAQDTSEDRSP